MTTLKTRRLVAVLAVLPGALVLSGAQGPAGKDDPKGRAGGATPPAAAAGATFQGTPGLLDAVQISHNISPDKRAATVVFANLGAFVSDVPPPPEGTPPRVAAMRNAVSPVGVRTATVSLPVQSKDKPTRLRQDIRGHVQVADNGRAVLVVQAAGKTSTVDLKKAADKDGNYSTRIEGTLPPGANYQVTFFLLVERLTAEPPSGAGLTVEALDVELAY